MAKIKSFEFNELGVNSFVLYDETNECIIIDPGCNSENQYTELTNFIHTHSLKTVYIVNTHGHFDHIFGNAKMKEAFNCPILVHREDLPMIEFADKYAGIFGHTFEKSPLPEEFLVHDQILHFGNTDIKILHVPGHSPGSVCLYLKSDNLLICGDVLFNGSIGRTDLFGGNSDLLITGIREKLLTLPRETIVLPGHGPKTTIGQEYDTNPFLQ